MHGICSTVSYASYRFLSEGNTPYLDTFFHKVQIIQISPTICIT
jgi:hypothetical protein